MTARALRMLYRDVPEVHGCMPACGKCCGPVPWSPAELAAVEGRIPSGTVRLPAPGGTTEVMLVHPLEPRRCPMLGPDKACTVYEARPLMCRMFGAVDGPGMVCPFGAKARRVLSDAQGRALANRYKAAPP